MKEEMCDIVLCSRPTCQEWLAVETEAIDVMFVCTE